MNSSAEQPGAGAIGKALPVSAGGLCEPLGRPGFPFLWPHASFARPLFALSVLRLMAFCVAACSVRSLARSYAAANLPLVACHTLSA